MIDYKEKYLKYKTKYLRLKELKGGNPEFGLGKALYTPEEAFKEFKNIYNWVVCNSNLQI